MEFSRVNGPKSNYPPAGKSTLARAFLRFLKDATNIISDNLGIVVFNSDTVTLASNYGFQDILQNGADASILHFVGSDENLRGEKFLGFSDFLLFIMNLVRPWKAFWTHAC